MIQQYTQYTQTLDNFLSTIVSIANIKLDLRPDGDKFILENSITYSKIYRDSPYIDQGYWKEGIGDYDEYLACSVVGNNYHARKRRVYDKFTTIKN